MRPKGPAKRHGLLLVDKPQGLTSHDVVGRLRRVVGQRQIGHTGTLDPMATGLMAVLLGSATKLSSRFTGLGKVYEATVDLSLATDTLDVTGETLARHGGPWPTEGEIRAALAAETGERDQVPPAYSAIKVGGRPAYKAARAGQPLDLPPRRVTAYGLELTAYEPPLLRLTAAVSSGYYVRALARDLGAALKTGGALAALRRASVGPWPVGQAATLEEIAAWDDDGWQKHLIDPMAALGGLTLPQGPHLRPPRVS